MLEKTVQVVSCRHFRGVQLSALDDRNQQWARLLVYMNAWIDLRDLLRIRERVDRGFRGENPDDLRYAQRRHLFRRRDHDSEDALLRVMLRKIFLLNLP